MEKLYTPGSSRLEKLARLCFSGGVADCMEQTGQDPLRYGDISILLGQSLRQGLLGSALPRLRPEEPIRATVVGAGSYTTSVSGSTITYSEAALFPLKNLPMLRLTPEEQALCLEGRGEELEEKIRWFLAQQDTDQLILSLPGLPDPEYAPLQRLARALAGAAHRALPPGRPALVVLKQDMAKALGLLMKKELNGARPVVCLDGVRAEQGDYVDLGRPVLEGLAIPVVVKTLLFG